MLGDFIGIKELDLYYMCINVILFRDRLYSGMLFDGNGFNIMVICISGWRKVLGMLFFVLILFKWGFWRILLEVGRG